MSETDAEDGIFASQFLNSGDEFGYVLGIAGAVGEEYAVRFHEFDFRCVDIKRNDSDVASVLIELTDDIKFDAAVDGDYVVLMIGCT